ncbi:MAG: DUF5060 domain-containing protein [Chloroflexota bacterium]
MNKNYYWIWGALIIGAIVFIVSGTTMAGNMQTSAENNACGGLVQQAEAGTLHGAMAIGEEGSVTYVHAPRDQGKVLDGPHPNNKVDYCFTVDQSGTYVLKAVVKARDHEEDSFWVIVGGKTYLWDTGATNKYELKSVTDRASQAKQIELKLSAGQHTITFNQREAGARIDRIELVATSLIEDPAPTEPKPIEDPVEDPIDEEPSCGELRQEAEDAELFGAMTTGNHDKASGKKYIHIPNSAGNAGKTPDWDNRAEFCMTVDVAGEYQIKANAHAPDSTQDSFHVTVDGAPSAGYLWQPAPGAPFREDIIHDRGKNDAQTIYLSKGDHKINFHRRESGTLLDWIELVPMFDLGSPVEDPIEDPTEDPPARPQETATPLPPTATATTPPPTATPDTPSSACHGLVVEAEHGSLKGNMTIGQDSRASGGQFIQIEDKHGHAPNGKIDLNNRADFCVEVPQSGDYQILARVHAPDSNHDSFFVTIDGAPSAGHVWDVQNNNNYVDDFVNDRGKTDKVTVTLSEGKHIISFYRRETGTRLDKFELRFTGGNGSPINPTATATAKPTDPPPTQQPPTATSTSVPPTPTQQPPSAPACNGLLVEGENGTLKGAFAIGTNSNASGGKFVYVPATAGNAPGGRIDMENRVDYCVNVETAGNYQMLARVKAPSSVEDSFFVTIDGAPSAGYVWDVAQGNSFKNDYLNDRSKSDPTAFYLSKGQHTISIHRREVNTQLDRFELIQVGGGNPNPTATPIPTQAPVNTPTATPEPPPSGGGTVSGSLLNPLDISFNNPTWSGNPFDLIAVVTFRHQASGITRKTEMYYNGDNEWRARFTADRTGTWTYSTESSDGDLNGKRGNISINGSNAKGFVVADGDKWSRSGTGDAFVPQYLMAAELDRFYNDKGKINRDLDTFMGGHGFTGFHIRGYCHWFELGKDRCNYISSSNRDPDIRTFEVVESIIMETYRRGGSTHIWMYGDNMRKHNPTDWGLNGTIDQRMQRYFAARLGALPGWTMGYGYDVYEWASSSQINTWYNYLDDRMMYPHLMGARGTKNSIMQYTEILSYSGYEKHHPDYNWYVSEISDRSHKPSFSEDRFRVDQAFQFKDYTFEETRRGLWHSAMAGGVANIWGNMQFDEGGSYQNGSREYPNRNELNVYSDFMNSRFHDGLDRCNHLTNGYCLKNGNNTQFIFYRENASSISLNLGSMSGSQAFVAINTKTGQQVTGTFQPGQQTWNAPGSSDWAIAIGNW